jgi:hypothetical protein
VVEAPGRWLVGAKANTPSCSLHAPYRLVARWRRELPTTALALRDHGGVCNPRLLDATEHAGADLRDRHGVEPQAWTRPSRSTASTSACASSAPGARCGDLRACAIRPAGDICPARAGDDRAHRPGGPIVRLVVTNRRGRAADWREVDGLRVVRCVVTEGRRGRTRSAGFALSLVLDRDRACFVLGGTARHESRHIPCSRPSHELEGLLEPGRQADVRSCGNRHTWWARIDLRSRAGQRVVIDGRLTIRKADGAPGVHPATADRAARSSLGPSRQRTPAGKSGR